jgi:tRNA 2-thiocytidine biosynthesis protein TtcA
MTNSLENQIYWLLKDVNKAVYDFDMIHDGDRIAVAVSGGVDSLSMLSLLDRRLKSSAEKYELVIIHVIGDSRGPDCPIHQPLVDWIENYGLEHRIERLYLPPDEALPLNCHRCTWNRRRTIFEAAKQTRCNLVALGHHADDLAETTLLNLMFHGKVETMAPVADYFGGAFKLIRPMCYLTKKQINRLVKLSDFPAPPPVCPRSDETQREVIRRLIEQAEQHNSEVRVNLLRAGLRGSGFE